MNHIDEIFYRMNLSRFSKHICTDLDYRCDEKRNYAQQLKEDSKEVFDTLESLLPETALFEDVSSKIYEAFSTYQTVYFEIGLNAGARFFAQLMFENEKELLDPNDILRHRNK